MRIRSEARPVGIISTYEFGLVPASLWRISGRLAKIGVASELYLLSEFSNPDDVPSHPVLIVHLPMYVGAITALDLCRRVRERNPDCLLVFVDTYASLLRDEIDDLRPSVVAAHPEELDLERLFLSAGGQYLSFETDGADLSANMAAEFRARFRPEAFGRFRARGRESLCYPIYLSEGCRYRCYHCPVFVATKGTHFQTTRDGVESQIEMARSLGVKHLSFRDAEFLNDPDHAVDNVRRIATRMAGPFTFDFTSKVSALLANQENVRALADLGCSLITTAFEFPDDGILRKLNKHHSVSDLRLLVAFAQELAMPLSPTFVPFNPWAGLDELEKLIEFIRTENLIDQVDVVQYIIRLFIVQGSPLGGRSLQQSAHITSRDGPFVIWQHRDSRIEMLWRMFVQLVTFASKLQMPRHKTFDLLSTVISSVSSIGSSDPSGVGFTISNFCCSEPVSQDQVAQLSVRIDRLEEVHGYGDQASRSAAGDDPKQTRRAIEHP